MYANFWQVQTHCTLDNISTNVIDAVDHVQALT